jgi:mRNA interferase MazF
VIFAMSEKDFSGWQGLKPLIHHSTRNIPSFKAREVWWCSLGLNIGYEQDGKGKEFSRPVLVVRKFSRQLFLGVPLTTQMKTHAHYLPIRFKGMEQSVILFQMRAFDARRLTDKMGDLPQTEFEKVRQALRDRI